MFILNNTHNFSQVISILRLGFLNAFTNGKESEETNDLKMKTVSKALLDTLLHH